MKPSRSAWPLVIALVLACHPATTETPPPSTEPQPSVERPASAEGQRGARQCRVEAIASPDRELPAEIAVQWDAALDPAVPWRPSPLGSAAPWLYPEADLLIVPRPSSANPTGATWHAHAARSGASLSTFEVDDPSALPAALTLWLSERGVADPTRGVALRAIPLSTLGSRQTLVDADSGWQTYSAPAGSGDADLYYFYRATEPEGCQWGIGIGEEAYSRLPSGSVDWTLHTTTLWVAPAHHVGVLAAVYSAHTGDAHGLAHRILAPAP